ncbi:MAG TPA: PA14 domain-containing protein [bacterium]|nr:PA14 domain-containing protein [bacterium]
MRTDKKLSAGIFGGILVSWALVLLALLSLPNAKFVFPYAEWFAHLPFYPFFLMGFVGLVYFLRQVTEASHEPDLGSRWSRPIFFLILGVGALLRLYDLHRQTGCYDNDHWIYANEALQIMVAGDRPVLLPYGTREPLFAYFSAALWSLAPKTTAIVAMRLSSVAVDLLILWSFYLLGKEAGGRRAGLILMAMGALSKTLIQISKINFGFHADVLACALAVLFLFRLLKDPKLRHFLQWGGALVLGSYIYVAFRLWTPVLIGGVWLWSMVRPQTRPQGPLPVALAWAVMIAWSFAFFYVNRTLPHEWGWVQFFGHGGGFILLVLVLVGLYVKVGLDGRGREPIWKWASGALLTALLLMPLWSQPGYSDHPNEMVIFHPRFGLTQWEAWKYVLHNIWTGFQMIFSYDPENPFWNLPPMKGDSYMDLFVPAFGTVALAAFVGRPRLIQACVLGLFWVGYASFFVTHGAHSNRLMAALLPLYLIAAWGAYRLWQVFRSSPLAHGRAWGTALFILWAGWTLVANYRILEQWMAMRWPDALAQDVLNTPPLPQDRVYLTPNEGHFGEGTLDLVCEGRDAHLSLASNPIDLVEGTRGKDLAVIIWGGDDPIREKLERAFPGGTWHERKSEWPITSLKWITVPFDRLKRDPRDYFYVRYTPASYWWRRFYMGLGLGRGMIRFEDRSARWNDSLPPSFVRGENTGRIDGTWMVTRPGTYEIRFRTSCNTQLWLDGKKVLEMQRAVGDLERKSRLELSAGPHAVELLTAFTLEHSFPAVRVRSLEEGWDRELDELSTPVAR